MTKRRDFLRTSAMLAAGTMILPMGCSSGSEKTAETAVDEYGRSVLAEPGLQIYSVRDALQEDFAGTISRIAKMGYKNVEAYGLKNDGLILGMDPAEYAKIVSDNGMKVVATHCDYFDQYDSNAFIEAAQAAGIEYVIIPSTPQDKRDNFFAVADNLNQIGENMKSSGLKFGYHNHDFEFASDGEDLRYDILLNNTQADLVSFEMDLYWVTKGGYNPMDYIEKYPGRFCSFHVKDATKDLEQTTLGTGIIDFPTILKARDEAGIKYYFVEDERKDDPFGNMEANYAYMKKTDFA